MAYICKINGFVAQLDRVLASEAKGCGFDSRRGHSREGLPYTAFPFSTS